MTRITNPKARKLGGWLIAGSLLAIPLTATWAATYVDVAAPIPPVARPTVTESTTPPVMASVTPQASPAVSTAAALPPAAAKLAALASASTAAMPVTPGEADISFIGKDTVRIHGQTKRWDELTGPELAEIRTATVKARTDLNRQIANLPEELAQVRKEAERFRSGEFKRQIIEARAGAERSLSEIELQSARLRAAGQDPQKMKADISKSLRELRAMDIDQMTRESLVSLDENKIRNDVMNAAKSLDEVERKLDMYQGR